MATNIRLKAAKLLNRQYPSSYYDAVGCKINPVFTAFKKEKEDFFLIFRMKSIDVPSVYGRPSMTLFEILKKYRSLLPQEYFLKQLLKIGNFLRDEEEYILALSCYNFYFLELNINMCSEEHDLQSYKKCYFPQGLQSTTSTLTIQILIANYFCMYQIEKKNCLQCFLSADECEQILLSYQMLTQVLLPENSYCWLLYNCTVHMYTICHDMMMIGHSAKIVQYLIWACLCVENSPLLSDVCYLSWRSTMYTAVCQCYWEFKAGDHAEAFARRALSRINDIWKVEKKNDRMKNNQQTIIMRECTLKMAVMIFKRVVFETRRKSKGFVRLKNRFSEKDFVNLSWPRTNTEKLLVEMFDSESAQFLAIMESLSDSHLRILTQGGIFQGETELIDVSLELFAAAKDVVSGNVVNNRSRKDSYSNLFANVSQTEDNSLLELAIIGDSRIPLKPVFHLTVLAFCYEQWEFFINFADALLKIKDEKYAWDVKNIQLLLAMEKLVHGRKLRKGQISVLPSETDNEDDFESEFSENFQLIQSGYFTVGVDDIFNLSQVLKIVLTSNFCPTQVDLTIVLDVVFFLWKQTKVVLRRHQIGFEDNSKFFQKTENVSKWLPILDVIFSVMCWCDVSSIDITILSEATLRLALLLEVSANLTQGKKSWKDIEKKEMLLMSSPPEMSFRKEGDSLNSNLVEYPFIPSDINLLTKEDFLRLARSVLMKGLTDINQARDVTAKKESLMSRNALDVTEVDSQLFGMGSTVTVATENVNKLVPKDQLLNIESPLCHSIRDQHTELLFIYYRISCRLIRTDIYPMKLDPKKDLQSSKKNLKKKKEDTSMVTYEMLYNECGSNSLMKSLLKMQAAVVANESKNELLQKSLTSLMNFQKDESKIYEVNNSIYMLDKESTVPKSDVPLAPILLWRSPSAMAFKPAKFNPTSGEKVCWYRLFAQIITTSYNKVRLNDTPIPGTGNLVPANYKEIIVTGMKTNQQYVFALGAYTNDGKLIGDNIGDSTTPILVSNSLSIPLTYVFLCQISCQLKCFSISGQIFESLCSHFVKHIDTHPSIPEHLSVFQKFIRKFPRINKNVWITASPIFLRQFYTCIMTSVDINIHTEKLFCDKLCEDGPFQIKQKKRLAECRKMLFALDIAGFLNDSNLCVQALVQIYGLLVPFLYHSWIFIPVIQILLYCYGVLQELPINVRQKKPAAIVDSIHHMITCMVYHLSKMLLKIKEKNIALEVCETGCRMLQEDIMARKTTPVITESYTVESETNDKGETPNLSHTKLRQAVKSKQDINTELNLKEELIILEEALIYIDKQANNDAESGVKDEDNSVGLIYCSIMPSRQGSKEAVKQKKKMNYHEFLIRVLRQAITEKDYGVVESFCEELHSYYNRKLDLSIKPPLRSKGTATVVEYNKGKQNGKPREKKAQPKKLSAPPRRSTSSGQPLSTLAQGKKRIFSSDPPDVEAVKMKALAVLTKYAPKCIKNYLNRKHTRQLLEKELPYKCQLNILHTAALFNSLLERYELYVKMQPYMTAENIGRGFDYDWISFENSGLFLNFKVTGKTTTDTIPLKPDDKIPHNAKYTLGVHPKTHMDLNVETTCDCLDKLFLHLRKALVLSHRGEMWSNFQYINKILWDIIQAIQLRIVGIHLEPAPNGIYISMDCYKKLIYPILVTASDLLLDMLQRFKKTNEETNTLSPEYSVKADPWSNTLNDFKGSSNLHFDPSLDDVTVIDGHTIEKICKKAMVAIHHQQKWEHLIDIILRFNALTNEKFAEFTFPLLVDAQLNLEKQCNVLNSSTAANLEQLINNSDGSLSTKKYLNLQLKVSLNKSDPVPLGVYLDARSSNSYKGSKLISVPLDVDSSWKYIQSVLEESDYTMRSVYHSRQLLHLYLAGRFYSHNNKTTGEEVEIRSPFLFLENILEPLPSPDIHLNLDSPSDAISCFNASNLNDTVITSYSQTIELLLNKNEKGLAAQMLSEMGHVQLISGDRKAALQSWITSLELILRLSKKSINKWKQVYQEDTEAQLLKICGIWGCLLGGTIAAHIARYCIVNDTNLQMEFCFLAYHMYKAIFCGSLQHPYHDIKFAMYNVGDNFMTLDIISDVNLFSDHYRCPSRQLVFCLQSVIETLYINGYYLKMLPILTLLLYLTRRLFRDMKLFVQGQIFRLQALTSLHMFTEATQVFQQLISGYHLPQANLTLTRLIEPKMELLGFDSSLNLTDPGNLKVLHLICVKYLTNHLIVLYGLQVSSELSLAIIRLLITLAECINVIPEEDESFATLIKNVHGHDIDNGDVTQNIFTATDGPITLERIKGLLLFVATHRLEILMTELQLKTENKIKNLSPFHVEMKIKGSLERSRIYQQKHQFYFAAKHYCETMNQMQQLKLQDLSIMSSSLKSQMFSNPSSKSQENITEGSTLEVKPSILNNTTDVDYLSKIGPSLWLQCRLNLVKSMNSFVPFEDHYKEFGEPLLPELASVMQYCQEGQQEAKICNDFETEADFIYMEVQNQFKMTHCTKTCKDICQKGINVIQQCSELSDSGLQTLVRLLMLQTDLQIKANEPLSVPTAQLALNVYVKVKELVENRLQILDPNIKVKKLKNIYLPFLDILAAINLRVALMSVKYSQHIDVNNLMSAESKQRNKIFNSLELLNEALLLNRSNNSHQPHLAMEILLQTGKVQRLLCRSISPSVPISSFIEAIKVDYAAHHNMVLTKSAYLEISLVCFSYLKETIIFQCQKTKLKTGKNEYESRLSLLEPQKEKYLAMLAWLAIRTTAILSNKHMQEISLRGSLKLASQAEIPAKFISKIPDFINMDIFAKYVFGKKRIKYENEFEKEYAEMMKNQPQKYEYTESEEEQMKKIKAISSSTISWQHIFSYLVSLSDELYQTIVSANETFQEGNSQSDEAPESFYKTFMYSMALDQSIRLQYTNTYSFLTHNFSLFTRHCSAINILPEIEELASVLNITMEEDQNIVSESLKALNLDNCSAKGLSQDSQAVNNRNISIFPWSLPYPKSEEVCFQWYSPLFESLSQENLPNHSESNNMRLLCSMTKKVKHDGYQCYTNNFLLPRKFAVDLYKRIKKAIHMKEINGKPLNSKSKKNMLASKRSFCPADIEIQDYQKYVFSILQEIQNLFAPTSETTISQFSLEETNLNHLLELFNVKVGSHLITGELAVWLTNLVFSEKT